MNLRSSCLSVLGLVSLVSVLGMSSVGCDSDSKKAEPVKTDAEVKAAEPAKTEPVKTEPVKIEPAKIEPTPTDVKAADTAAAGDTKTADTAAGDTKTGDMKAGDMKTADTKTETKTPDKKPADTKPADKTPAIDGKPLYDSKCKVCHAADGKGTEAMKKNNIPDMSDKGWQGKHSKAVVAKAVTNGIDGTKMKSFKDKLKPEEIDAVAAYVKKLK